MPKRLRSYYPDSAIQKGLYTDGNEYITENGIAYVGYYHKYTSGEVFSLYEYSDSLSEKLIPISERHTLDTNKVTDPNNYSSPTSVIPYPSIEYFNNKKIWYRFFVRKVSDYQWGIREINEEQFESIISSNKGSINGYLYKTIKVPWKLTGNLYDIHRNGIKFPGVYDTNFRTIELFSRDFPGLESFITDPLEYTQYSVYYDRLTKSQM